MIRAADPSRTRIIGNFQFTYLFQPPADSIALPGPAANSAAATRKWNSIRSSGPRWNNLYSMLFPDRRHVMFARTALSSYRIAITAFAQSRKSSISHRRQHLDRYRHRLKPGDTLKITATGSLQYIGAKPCGPEGLSARLDGSDSAVAVERSRPRRTHWTHQRQSCRSRLPHRPAQRTQNGARRGAPLTSASIRRRTIAHRAPYKVTVERVAASGAGSASRRCAGCRCSPQD